MDRVRTRYLLGAVLLALAVMWSSAVHAQVTTGTILGTVKDQSGLPSSFLRQASFDSPTGTAIFFVDSICTAMETGAVQVRGVSTLGMGF
jgi:hypothetical protein